VFIVITQSKNRRNTTERLELKKYSPVTKKHEFLKKLNKSQCNNHMVEIQKDTRDSDEILST
jgi:ribosomal protein L33